MAVDPYIYLRIVAWMIIFLRRYSSQRAKKMSPIDGNATIAITIISGPPNERPNPELHLSMYLIVRPTTVKKLMQNKPTFPIMLIILVNYCSLSTDFVPIAQGSFQNFAGGGSGKVINDNYGIYLLKAGGHSLVDPFPQFS